MDAFEVLAGQEPAVTSHVPRNVAGVSQDLRVGRFGHEPSLRFIEIALVGERKFGLLAVAKFDREPGRLLSERVEVLARPWPAIRWKQRGARGLGLCADCKVHCRHRGNNRKQTAPRNASKLHENTSDAFAE